jgi:hypothetical protein
LATVTYDAETGLFETYIELPFAANQLGRIDASQERAVRKAEDFLIDKLQLVLRGRWVVGDVDWCQAGVVSRRRVWPAVSGISS